MCKDVPCRLRAVEPVVIPGLVQGFATLRSAYTDGEQEFIIYFGNRTTLGPAKRSEKESLFQRVIRRKRYQIRSSIVGSGKRLNSIGNVLYPQRNLVFGVIITSGFTVVSGNHYEICRRLVKKNRTALESGTGTYGWAAEPSSSTRLSLRHPLTPTRSCKRWGR